MLCAVCFSHSVPTWAAAVAVSLQLVAPQFSPFFYTSTVHLSGGSPPALCLPDHVHHGPGHYGHHLRTPHFILTLSCAFLTFSLLADIHRKEDGMP